MDSALEWIKLYERGDHNNRIETVKKEIEFKPKWTADIIDLIELSMSLHERRAINNREVSITAVVNFFFNLFGIKPGNFFSSYGVMRTRAGSRTLFLDELKNSIEQKMDRDDEKEEKQQSR